MRSARQVALMVLAVCLMRADANAQLRTAAVASGFTYPVAVVQDPTNHAVFFVVQQDGHIRAVQNGVVLDTDFLDMSTTIGRGGERGLLGMALAPDFATNGRFFLNFTSPDFNTVVARFKRSANPLLADPASRLDLRWSSGNRFIVDPYSNHNGGHLAFGPDGYLYVALGDGGDGHDPENRAQTPSEYWGKVLRVDVAVPDSDVAGMRVPADNPFLSSGPAGTRPEIWAFGLRNPWRYSFDDRPGGTGALILADVGQDTYEEIDYEPAGAGGRNYGWRVREGSFDQDLSLPPAYLPMTDPTFEYGHSVGVCITGGYVYRGTALGAAYRGRYFYADYIYQRLWSLVFTVNPSTGEATASDVQEHTSELGGAAAIGSVVSFGVDSDGELYFLSHLSGKLFKIGPPPAAPASLTATPRITGAIDLAWPAVGGATSYVVKRSTTAGAETVLASGVTGTAYSDGSGVQGQTYYYQVSTVSAFGEGANSAEATATSQSLFVDDPVVSGVTPLRAVHISELRSYVNTLRARYGLGAVAWTDPTVGAGVTPPKAIHVLELRAALDAAYTAAGLSRPVYSGAAPVTGGLVLAIHINELRSAVLAIW